MLLLLEKPLEVIIVIYNTELFKYELTGLVTFSVMGFPA